MELTVEAREALRKIEFHNKKLVKDLFSGLYRSVYRGRGMEFDSLREYSPGDEIRHIDWNVSARMNRPYVKEFVEERELTVMLVADCSSSMLFGGGKQTKQQLMAEVGALLAMAAVENRDRVGLLLFGQNVERFIPPARGMTQAMRIASELLAAPPVGRRTNYAAALEALYRIQKRHCLCFFLSDFLHLRDLSPFATAGRRYDSIALAIGDRREWRWPSAGLVRIRGLEGEGGLLVDSADPHYRQRAEEALKGELKGVCEGLRGMGIDWLQLCTGAPYLPQLVRFFSGRREVWGH